MLPADAWTDFAALSTWAVLIVVTGGLILSFTPLRKLETKGASHLGYTALYLLLAGIGARADLRAVLDAPVYLLAGAVWIAIHVAVLLVAARLVRAPLFFVATGSMANIGGAASAPVVAGGLSSRDGADRAADGGGGVHSGDLRGDPVRGAAGVGGGVSGPRAPLFLVLARCCHPVPNPALVENVSRAGPALAQLAAESLHQGVHQLRLEGAVMPAPRLPEE